MSFFYSTGCPSFWWWQSSKLVGESEKRRLPYSLFRASRMSKSFASYDRGGSRPSDIGIIYWPSPLVHDVPCPWSWSLDLMIISLFFSWRKFWITHGFEATTKLISVVKCPWCSPSKLPSFRHSRTLIRTYSIQWRHSSVIEIATNSSASSWVPCEWTAWAVSIVAFS